MNKIIAYYSLIITIFTVLICIFTNEGDIDVILGGIIFIPVIYSLWEMITELKGIEEKEKIKKQIVDEERIRKEIKEEIKNEK
ncbi:MAG: hypothetical protein KAU07_03880 [Candidatus Andersenbacteria bacterium]|jgi:hypothetical protein|nr:hypothetical protein [Candidatus Andersenbacteria bacterium]